MRMRLFENAPRPREIVCIAFFHILFANLRILRLLDIEVGPNG